LGKFWVDGVFGVPRHGNRGVLVSGCIEFPVAVVR
jgi:hypothetical protein